MTARPSQTALYGELLTNEQVYHKDVGEHPRLSHEEEEALIAQARLGNMQAREALVLSLLSVVLIYARWLYVLYHWELPHIEYLDMVQEGNMALLRRMDAALATDNPGGYLCRAARGAIHDYCWPARERRVAPELVEMVESLDRVLNPGEEDEVTLADVLEVPSCSPTACDRRRFAPIRQAVAVLPPQQRMVIRYCYDLDDEETGAMEGIEHLSSETIKHVKTRATRGLYGALSRFYPQYSTSQEPPSQEPCYGVELREDHRARLDAARERLEAMQQRVSVRSLSKEARIDHSYASVYLKQRGGLQASPRSTKQIKRYLRRVEKALAAAL